MNYDIAYKIVNINKKQPVKAVNMKVECTCTATFSHMTIVHNVLITCMNVLACQLSCRDEIKKHNYLSCMEER